jgi:hypothetical protein
MEMWIGIARLKPLLFPPRLAHLAHGKLAGQALDLLVTWPQNFGSDPKPRFPILIEFLILSLLVS